ncbi:MAG: GGDEF domain-containing protein [Lachnospiraceae bacterium]|nr:GGDEF domain-containing protein [Lachnospiraceae bacterium]
MKTRGFNKKYIIIALILGISIVFFYQYQAFISRSQRLQRENAYENIRAVYEQALAKFDEVYTDDVVYSSYELNNLIDSLKGINVATHLDGVVVSVVLKEGNERGRMLPVTGSLYEIDTITQKGSIFIDYLKSCSFERGYSYEAFRSAFDARNESLTKYYDPNVKDTYYLYYADSAFKNIDIIALYRADKLDTSLDVIKGIANGFFFTEFTVFILLVAWLIFAHVYDMITSKHENEHIESIQRRYRTALTNKNNFIWEYFLDTDTMLWDEANSVTEPLFDVSGQHRKETISSEKIHPEDQWTFYQFCDDLVTNDPVVSSEIRLKDTSGTYRWYRFTGTKVFNNDQSYPVSVIGQTSDINSDKLETEKLREEASRDTLTKLYNYQTFQEMVESVISHNEDAEIMAFMLVDVDDFTTLNTSYGYAFADALLVDIAGRLRRIFPENTIIGRFGGDEFVALVRNVPSMSFVVELAQSILSAIQNTMSDSNQKYGLSCSIGISLFPVDDLSFQQLFNKADMALYDAKSKGKGRYSVYNTGMKQIPETTRNKNNIKLMMPSSTSKERQSVDSTILGNTIYILFDSRDLNMSINVMLSIIGIYYKLDHFVIAEFKEYETDTKAKVLFEWASDKKYKLPEKTKETEYSTDDLFLGYEADASSAFCCDDVAELTASGIDLTKDPYLFRAKAFIQHGIKYKSNYIYYINGSSAETRVFKKEEQDSLLLLAKLVGSYLVQLRSQETLDFVSQMDTLTGAYNYSAFLQRADKRLSANDNTQYAFIYANIQQFKLLNDTYGYTAGDSILLGLSEILQKVVGANALISRISGDRFVVMYPYENGTDLQAKIKRIINDAKRIPQQNGEYYRFALTIGIYLVEAGDTAMIAVDRAIIALKNISDYHNCSYMFYDESMHETLIEQKDIEDTMEQSLKNNEFLVYYQPKVDLRTNELVGSEALVRLQHNGELIPPVKFIPVFEENGFILQLDYYMLDKVCATMRKCLDEGLPVKPVSVNFSRLHLNNTVLPSKIEATLKKYRIEPSLIEVEITESALNAQNTYQQRILSDIHKIGCRLAMDDFGSGVSSLNTLCELPFDVLKLDKYFLQNNVVTAREQVIIKNIVTLAKELNMKVICEGVETEDQAEFLRRIGCEYGQGYLFSKPVPEKEFLDEYYRG